MSGSRKLGSFCTEVPPTLFSKVSRYVHKYVCWGISGAPRYPTSNSDYVVFSSTVTHCLSGGGGGGRVPPVPHLVGQLYYIGTVPRCTERYYVGTEKLQMPHTGIHTMTTLQWQDMISTIYIPRLVVTFGKIEKGYTS